MTLQKHLHWIHTCRTDTSEDYWLVTSTLGNPSIQTQILSFQVGLCIKYFILLKVRWNIGLKSGAPHGTVHGLHVGLASFTYWVWSSADSASFSLGSVQVLFAIWQIIFSQVSCLAGDAPVFWFLQLFFYVWEPHLTKQEDYTIIAQLLQTKLLLKIKNRVVWFECKSLFPVQLRVLICFIAVSLSL